MARFCAQCGASLEEHARFCAECGHEVGAGTPGEEASGTTPADTDAAGTPAAASAGISAGAGMPPGSGAVPTGRRGGGRGRWALIILLVVALVAGGVVTALLLSGGEQAGAKEITLEPADSQGPGPFTDSTATERPPDSTSPDVPPPPPPLDTTAQGTERTGGTEGLYGGSLNQAACDVERQIAFLQRNPDKASAFAGVLGITVEEIPAYLRGLTPMVLRFDTRVTNHGFFDGRATPRQAVLQAGTAVLVDKYGVPRVKCGCGNPLTPPADLAGTVTYYGDRWDGFSLRDTVIVIENDIDIDIFVLVDFDLEEYFRRHRGDDDGSDDELGGETDNGGGEHGGGGGRLTCPATPEEAVAKVLKARRADDRDAALLACGTPPVIDYLWGLSDDFTRSLTSSGCEPVDDYSDPYRTGAKLEECTLSNGAVIYAEYYRPAAEGWILVQVSVAGEGGTGATTGTGASLRYGDPCTLGSVPDCIDPDGDGTGTYLRDGASCMQALAASPELCSDLDGDGVAGYPDSG